jgi:hypothetical protein
MAGLDFAEFIESVCLACDESKLVTSYKEDSCGGS